VIDKIVAGLKFHSERMNRQVWRGLRGEAGPVAGRQ
jgi:hypothetical protein